MPGSIHPAGAVPELVTLLIPTRARADTLEHCLTTCVRQQDSNLRILVSDNASDDSTKLVVDKFRRKDSRVAYINPGHRLGMSEHWEFGLEHIREGFVTVLGDDDGLLPEALPAIRAALKDQPQINAISWPYSFYGYPSLFTPSKNHLGLACGKEAEVRQSSVWLAKLAAFEVSYHELPMVYHGLVRAEVLEAIRKRTGCLISSFIPDVYLGIAVASSTESYYRLPQSLSIFGTSHHSNGAASMTAGANPSIVQSFWNETHLTSHPSIPYFPSIPAFVLESLLRAREAGILPDDLRIELETGVDRMFTELHEAGHPDEALEGYLERLAELCRNIDQERHFEWLKNSNPIAREALIGKLQLGSWLPKDHVLMDLSETAIKDIAGATSFASDLYNDENVWPVLRHMSNEIGEARTAFSNRLGQLREMDSLARSQQKALEKHHRDHTERIASLGRQLEETHAESTDRFQQVEKLTEQIAALSNDLERVSADSTARLQQIEKLDELLKVSEEDRANRLRQIQQLEQLAREQQQQLEKCNLDFSAKLADLGRRLKETFDESVSRHWQIDELTAKLKASQQALQEREHEIDKLKQRGVAQQDYSLR